ncbi:MAG: hypothetical protein AAF682_05575 [Planctomycetota bacterium]
MQSAPAPPQSLAAAKLIVGATSHLDWDWTATFERFFEFGPAEGAEG